MKSFNFLPFAGFCFLLVLMQQVIELVQNADAARPNPIQDVIDLVNGKPRIDRHGHSHIQFMTARRQIVRLQADAKTSVMQHIGAHVIPRLEHYNKKFAVRLCDIIRLGPKLNRSKTQVRGRGDYRSWTSSAILKACFGRGWYAAIRRRIRRKIQVGRLRPGSIRRRNVQATSLTAIADFLEGSASHVQKLRTAMALRYLKLQNNYINNLRHARIAIVEISFDEADMPAQIEGEAAIFSMLIVHIKITWIIDDERSSETLNLSVPPAFLANKTAKSILNALISRFPVRISTLLTKCSLLVIVPNSDSATSCKRVGRHFRRLAQLEVHPQPSGIPLRCGILSAHGACQMHMLAINIGNLLKELRILNPMFCGSCLMQKGGTRRKIKEAVHDRMHRTCRIIYDAFPPPEFANKVWDR